MIRRKPGLLALFFTLTCGAVLLAGVGDIDKWVAGLFYDSTRGFSANHSVPWTTLRESTRLSAYGVGAFLIFALIWRVMLGRAFFGLSRAAIIYLIAAFVLGPGLLVNGILKEEWGRARPSQIIEFGGSKRFTLPLTITDQCDHNCSFVSGEASLGFAFGAFGFAARSLRRRRLGFAAGVLVGSGFGLLRIAQGGHFLSDVFFAGVFIFSLSWALHHVLVDRGALDRLGLWPAERPAARKV